MNFSCLAQKLSNYLATAILFSSLLLSSYGAYLLYNAQSVAPWIVVLILLPLLYLPLYAFSMLIVLFLRNYIAEKLSEYIGLIGAFILLPLYLTNYFDPFLLLIGIPILTLFHLLMILSKKCNEDITVEDIINEEQFNA